MILSLDDVRGFIKDRCGVNSVYLGRIDDAVNNCIGINSLDYGLRHSPFADLKRYDVKGITLLLHGTKNKLASDIWAHDIYDKLASAGRCTIGSRQICEVQMQRDEPQEVDRDSNGVYEYVVDMYIIVVY